MRGKTCLGRGALYFSGQEGMRRESELANDTTLRQIEHCVATVRLRRPPDPTKKRTILYAYGNIRLFRNFVGVVPGADCDGYRETIVIDRVFPGLVTAFALPDQVSG
jgi:hypothetical protein